MLRMQSSRSRNNGSLLVGSYRHRQQPRGYWQIYLQVVLVVVCLGPTLTKVHAKCQVWNDDGQQLDLDKLPDGVYYVNNDNFKDEIRCDKGRSCQGFTIAQCHQVLCRGVESCRGAELDQNEIVNCWHSRSCQEAYFKNSHDVNCGGQHSTLSCVDATIETDTVVLCHGSHSCAAPGAKYGGLNVYAGTQGHVRCVPTVDELPACETIVVFVDRPERACFSMDLYGPKGPCAVVCTNNETACNRDSIKFAPDDRFET